jgi:hypothetical protein
MISVYPAVTICYRATILGMDVLLNVTIDIDQFVRSTMLHVHQLHWLVTAISLARKLITVFSVHSWCFLQIYINQRQDRNTGHTFTWLVLLLIYDVCSTCYSFILHSKGVMLPVSMQFLVQSTWFIGLCSITVLRLYKSMTSYQSVQLLRVLLDPACKHGIHSTYDINLCMLKSCQSLSINKR